MDGFETYHVMNPHDDGIGLDQYVDCTTISIPRSRSTGL
jgi:thioester reductase-like protein